MWIECLYAHSQLTVHCHITRSFVTMEGAFPFIASVMAKMTVEITVMKMDVSDGRWEEIIHVFYKTTI